MNTSVQHLVELGQHVLLNKERLYMKLQQYLDKYKTPKAALAREAGISRTTINNLLIKKMIPNLETAIAIEIATEGQVSVYDWLGEKGNVNTDTSVNQHSKKKK